MRGLFEEALNSISPRQEAQIYREVDVDQSLRVSAATVSKHALRKWLITVGVAVICMVAAVLLASRVATPAVTFNGRTVRSWALQLYVYGQAHDEAVSALKALGERAVPDLVRMLRRPDLPFRKQVSRAVPSMPASLRCVVLGVYRTPSASELRIAAARALAILGSEAGSASSTLEIRMRDRNPAVANEAGLALIQVDPRHMRQLESALRDRNPNARRAAAYALGGLGAETAPAIPELLARLSDPDQAVRQTAEGSLWRVGAAVVAPSLAFMGQEQGSIRERLAEGLVRLYLGPMGQARAIKELPCDTPGLQQARAEAIRRLGLSQPDPVVSRVLAAIMVDASAEVRVAAIDSVRGALLPSTVLALMWRLEDEDAQVRAAAARILGSQGAAGRPALRRLESLTADPQEAVRVAARQAVARIGGTPQDQ